MLDGHYNARGRAARIWERLWLGNLGDASHLSEGNPNGITTVIALSESSVRLKRRGVNYLHIPIEDAKAVPAGQFDAVMDAISENIRWGTVLVHGAEGECGAPSLTAIMDGHGRLQESRLCFRRNQTATVIHQSLRRFTRKPQEAPVMKKCAIYARVSTPEQRIDNQLYDLRLFAEQRGFEVACEYTDVGVSGSKARRPGLDTMLKDARKRRFGVVIVAAFDRVARSTKHFLSVVDELDGHGIEFISRRENIATDGAMGRLFLTVISSIAELEADLIRERIRAGMRRRKMDGLSVGRQPLDVDHDAVVADRLGGMSLTNVAKRYGVSRASVVRWVRESKQRNSATVATFPVRQEFLEECAA